jgi:hypothetical protein
VLDLAKENSIASYQSLDAYSRSATSKSHVFEVVPIVGFIFLPTSADHSERLLPNVRMYAKAIAFCTRHHDPVMFRCMRHEDVCRRWMEDECRAHEDQGCVGSRFSLTPLVVEGISQFPTAIPQPPLQPQDYHREHCRTSSTLA